MVYEILGLNVESISEQFTSNDLLDMKDQSGKVDYEKIKSLIAQKKSFNEIRLSDAIVEGDENMTFDVTVGNPPYQEIVGNENSNKALGKQLFPHFIILGAKISQYSSLITPSKWFSANGQDGSFPKLREFLSSNNHMQIIVNHLSNDIFPSISLGSVNYYLYNNEYTGDVIFTEIQNNNEAVVSRPLFETGSDIVLSMNIMSSYINKIANHPSFRSLTDHTTGRNPFKVPDSNERLNAVMVESEDAEHNIKIYCAYGETKYVSRNVIHRNAELIDKYKVFISKMNGAAGTIFDGKPVNIIGESFLGRPNEICSGALISIGNFSSESEARNLQKYLKTQFCRFMIGLMKSSQALYQNVYTYVPLQDFSDRSDIDWSKSIADIDAQLYTKYGLTFGDNSEVAFIESTIKPME